MFQNVTPAVKSEYATHYNTYWIIRQIGVVTAAFNFIEAPLFVFWIWLILDLLFILLSLASLKSFKYCTIGILFVVIESFNAISHAGMIYMASDQYNDNLMNKDQVQKWSGVIMGPHWLAAICEFALVIIAMILCFKGNLTETDVKKETGDDIAESVDDKLSGGEDEDLQNKIESYKDSKKNNSGIEKSEGINSNRSGVNSMNSMNSGISGSKRSENTPLVN